MFYNYCLKSNQTLQIISENIKQNIQIVYSMYLKNLSSKNDVSVKFSGVAKRGEKEDIVFEIS